MENQHPAILAEQVCSIKVSPCLQNITSFMQSTTINPELARLPPFRGGRRSRVRIPLKPWFFQASSFQLLKLQNSLRWSFFTLIYNRSSNIWTIVEHYSGFISVELTWSYELFHIYFTSFQHYLIPMIEMICCHEYWLQNINYHCYWIILSA